MTKKLQRFLAIFASNFLAPLAASSVGNPADPAILEEGFWISDQRFSSLRLGITGDYLINKRLRPAQVSEGLGIRRPEMEWTLAAVDLGWNIRERFDLHLLAGPATSFQLTWQQPGAFYTAKGRQGLFWGASSKLILLEIEDTTFGVDFHGGGISSIEGPLTKNGTPFSSSFSGYLHFWQIATGFSQNLGSFRPYLGAVVNQLVVSIEEEGLTTLRFQDLLQVGSYLGCSFSFGTKIFLNLESRQFFESGLSLSGELRF